MKIATLIYSDWEQEFLLNLATSLFSVDSDEIYAVFVGEKSDRGSLLSKFQKFSEKKGLELATESSSKNSLNFQLVSDNQEEIFNTIHSFKPDLLIAGKHDAKKSTGNQKLVVRHLFENLPSRMLTLRLGDNTFSENASVLVPTAGGPHSVEAIKLASRLGRKGGKANCLFIESPIGDLSKEVGEFVLLQLLEKAKIEDHEEINKLVVVSTNVEEVIIEQAKEHELVIVGASAKGSVRSKLFGTLPDNILSSKSVTSAVGVIRGELPLFSKLRIATQRILDLTVPQLTRNDRISLYAEIQRGAVWNFDFFALISLSTMIASLGLVQNSVAVIIGAMLVAPLMTPLLGAGLSIVQGNTPLMRSSLKAVLYGFLASLFFSFLVGLVTVGGELGSEILARSEPNVIDMAIALFSGIAAAYCLARPGLSSALAGIAIAAALVPPVASAGIALSLGEAQIARGATLLFSTNVVSIILGAAASFYGGGIRDSENRSSGMKFTSVVFGLLIVIAVALLIPLASYLLEPIAR